MKRSGSVNQERVFPALVTTGNAAIFKRGWWLAGKNGHLWS